jgi:thiamine pyrophosphate-dependent acetolactate synthase large subunit-like protein
VDAGPLECLDLHGPADIVKIAESFGVPAERVSALDELTASLKRGLAADGPYLIDMIIKEK